MSASRALVFDRAGHASNFRPEKSAPRAADGVMRCHDSAGKIEDMGPVMPSGMELPWRKEAMG